MADFQGLVPCLLLGLFHQPQSMVGALEDLGSCDLACQNELQAAYASRGLILSKLSERTDCLVGMTLS